MTEIKFTKKETKLAKCGDWLLIDGSLCVIAQTSSQKFQLICIQEFHSNRFNSIILESKNGFESNPFTHEELLKLTDNKKLKFVDVIIEIKK